jgi:DNA-binding transcriptional ArsR family regulator
MAQTKAATRTGKKAASGEDPHFLDTVERLKAMADPLRIRFILELLNGPSTVKEVAERLGVPPTRLYYHVKILERHGLIEVANRRMVSGIEERTYRAASKDWTVPPTLEASALYETGALRALFDVVRSEIEVAVQSRPDLPMDAPGSPLAGMGLTELELTPADLRELMERFEDALLKFAVGKKRRADAEPFHFFYALYPVPTSPSPDERP